MTDKYSRRTANRNYKLMGLTRGECYHLGQHCRHVEYERRNNTI